MRIWIQETEESLIRIRNTAQILSYVVRNCAACKCCSELGQKRKSSFSHLCEKYIINKLCPLPECTWLAGPESWRPVVPGGPRRERLHLRHGGHRGQRHQCCPLRHHEGELPQHGGRPRGRAGLQHGGRRLPAQEKLRGVQPHLALPRLRGENGQRCRDADHNRRTMCLIITSGVVFHFCIRCFLDETVDDM